ncbi:hypothetical protein [Virgibacillus alimentarius]|uniref:hypothetical protein n=1 Tax=Virgibacillus alimentarius TaxID=698769 RepID=UPI000A5967AE|nr:hypothetical protein [Virgibacillus alimentarius]
MFEKRKLLGIFLAIGAIALFAGCSSNDEKGNMQANDEDVMHKMTNPMKKIN